MKFPRNARIFRGHLDAAPFASVLFLFVIFLMLGGFIYTPGVRLQGGFIYTPGVRLQLPVAGDLPGTDRPTVAVAVGASGQFYFENQAITESKLREELRQAAKTSSEPLVLLVQADKAASQESLIRLSLLAREAGIAEGWLATLPRPFSPQQP